jgi:hypothetical protein
MQRRSSAPSLALDINPHGLLLKRIQIGLAFALGAMLGLGIGWFLYSAQKLERLEPAFADQSGVLSDLELERLAKIARTMRPEDLQRIFGIAQERRAGEEVAGEKLSTVMGLGTLLAIEDQKLDDARQILVARIARYYGLNSPGITGKSVSEDTAKLLKRIEDASKTSPALAQRLEAERTERAVNVPANQATPSTERITGGLGGGP